LTARCRDRRNRDFPLSMACPQSSGLSTVWTFAPLSHVLLLFMLSTKALASSDGTQVLGCGNLAATLVADTGFLRSREKYGKKIFLSVSMEKGKNFPESC